MDAQKPLFEERAERGERTDPLTLWCRRGRVEVWRARHRLNGAAVGTVYEGRHGRSVVAKLYLSDRGGYGHGWRAVGGRQHFWSPTGAPPPARFVEIALSYNAAEQTC